MWTGGLAALEGPRLASAGRVLPVWFRKRFQTAEPMIRYRSGVARTRGGLFGVWFALVCISFAWIISTDGSFIPIDASIFGRPIGGLPLGVAPPFIFVATLWLLTVTAQWWSRAERRVTQPGVQRVFAVGFFPTTRTYMIVRASDLVVVHGDIGEVAIVEWSRIDVAGLEGSWFGVGVSLSIDGAWYDFPIVLEVGGQVARHWAPDGRVATTRLLTAVRSSLESRVPVFVN